MKSAESVLRFVFAASLLVAAAPAGCRGGSDVLCPASPTPEQPTDDATAPGSAIAPAEVLVGAGDIAQCGVGDPEATARLLDRIPGTVFTLGDNVQVQGTAEEYAKCFEPTWGRHRWRMFPTIGNHDFYGTGGAPYFAYFGDRAGPAGLGYYSSTLGTWHVVALNSEIDAGIGSLQYEWLQADLAEASSACTIAMWHRPLFSSGPSGGSSRMRDAWRLLQRHRAEVVLSGHDHDYERFAPQDANGHATPDGLRAFVVGTGGHILYPHARVAANSEVWDNSTQGVLKLTLRSDSYDWEFVPVAGRSFRDSGTASCNPARARGTALPGPSGSRQGGSRNHLPAREVAGSRGLEHLACYSGAARHADRHALVRHPRRPV